MENVTGYSDEWLLLALLGKKSASLLVLLAFSTSDHDILLNYLQGLEKGGSVWCFCSFLGGCFQSVEKKRLSS